MFLTEDDNKQDKTALSDEEIFFASIDDPRLFEEIVDRYQEAFLRKAKKLLNTQENAEDAVQETFAKMYIYAHKFKVQEGASFKSWGYKILVNTCFTHGKKKKIHQERFAQIDPELEHLIADTHDQFTTYTLKEHILSILSRMPDSLSKVLEDYYIKGIPQKELAEEEGVSLSAIKTRVHRAKKTFKKISNSLSL